MRKNILGLFLLLSFVTNYAQGNTAVIPKGCFLLELTGGLGFSELQSQKFSEVSGQLTSTGILATYSFTDNFRLSTGAYGLHFKNSSLDANGAYANLKASFVEIPLKVNYSFDIMRSHTIQLVLGLGAYAGKNLNNSLKTQTKILKDIDKPWYFGWESTIGTEFAFNRNFVFGIYWTDENIPKFAKTEKLSLKDNSQIKIALLINLF